MKELMFSLKEARGFTKHDVYRKLNAMEKALRCFERTYAMQIDRLRAKHLHFGDSAKSFRIDNADQEAPGTVKGAVTDPPTGIDVVAFKNLTVKVVSLVNTAERIERLVEKVK